MESCEDTIFNQVCHFRRYSLVIVAIGDLSPLELSKHDSIYPKIPQTKESSAFKARREEEEPQMIFAWIGAAAWAVLGVNTVKLLFGKSDKPKS